jgi:hypothetical protein
MNSHLIIDWLGVFHNRTRLEKQEAIAECYAEKIRTAGQALNLIDLHGLWPRDEEDAWQNFVSVLQTQADEEDAAAALKYGVRPRKKPAEADRPISPRHVAIEAKGAPVDACDALMRSFAKRGVTA